jgi:hypothetical protein
MQQKNKSTGYSGGSAEIGMGVRIGEKGRVVLE